MGRCPLRLHFALAADCSTPQQYGHIPPAFSTNIKGKRRKGKKNFLNDYGSSKAPPLCVCTVTGCCSINYATPETLTLRNNFS